MLRSRLDRAFVRYARTGDPGALARVFDGCAGELYRLGFHLLGDRHAAEDLVQQTFVVAIEQAKTFDRSRRVLPWLCGILTNRALHARRQLRQRRDANAAARDDVVDAAAVAAARETSDHVAAAVRTLPEPYRQVLLLHLVHELTPQEVAEALSRPDATVRTQLARGLERLRKLLPVGIAGFAVGEVPPPLALGAVRDAVLAHAAKVTPFVGTAAGAGVFAFAGVVAMKKVLLVCAVLLAALSSWLWWSSEPMLPANADARDKVAANVAPQHAPVSPAAPEANGEAARTEAPAAVDPRTAALEVLVLWSDGTPAADIPVRVRPRPLDFEKWLRVARTDDAGIARFTSLPPGEANALTGRGANADVELAAGVAQRATIKLDSGIDVRGRVVDLDEKPIAGATVWMSVAMGSDDSEPVAVTGPDGAFAIRGAGARFVVTATAPGLGCAKEAWVGEPTNVITLTLRPAPGTLVGTVVDADGRPVNGARILLGAAMPSRGSGVHTRALGRIVGQDLWPSRFLRTDADGAFRSEGLPAIRWPLWVGAPGFAPWFQEVDLRADGPTEVAVRLSLGATLRGRVIDEAGAMAAGVQVSVWPDLPAPHELVGLGMKVFTQPPLWARIGAKTAADGSYQIQQVIAGKLTLRAWGAPRRTAMTECEVVDGQAFEWNAVLATEVDPSWQPFHGALADADGRSLTSALSSWDLRVGDPRDARNREVPFNTISVKEDGSFRTNAVPPGRYSIFVKPRHPCIGKEVNAGEFDLAACPVRIVVPRANVPTSRVRGRIVPPAGVSAKACFVWIKPYEAKDEADSRQVNCDDQGNFEAGPVLRGRYRLRVDNDAFGALSMPPIEVVDGRDCDVGTFQIPAPGTLVVRMVDPAGIRVPDVWVGVRPVGDDQRGGWLEHRDGIARGGLPAGRWLVYSREPASMAAIEVDVRAGETTEVPFVIPDGVPFALRTPATVSDRERMRMRWRDATGALVRDGTLYEDDFGKDMAFKAPAGRYTLEVTDPRGAKATTTFDLRASDPPLVVELPLPAK